jgi:molecular chaperone GrpE
MLDELHNVFDDARRLATLTEQMRELDARLNTAVADMVYARRRAQEDCQRERLYGIAGMARALLPFRDALETALAIDTHDVAALRAGLELAQRQLAAVLDRRDTVA